RRASVPAGCASAPNRCAGHFRSLSGSHTAVATGRRSGKTAAASGQSPRPPLALLKLALRKPLIRFPRFRLPPDRLIAVPPQNLIQPSGNLFTRHLVIVMLTDVLRGTLPL